MSGFVLNRRRLIVGGASAGLLGLSGCGDKFAENPTVLNGLRAGEDATYAWQRLIEGRGALAREFAVADISAHFKANGSTQVGTDEYDAMLDGGFADWRLKVDGLVQRPLALSLAQIKALPQRTQITRHDCVEGWSAIGMWTGPQLARVLGAAGVLKGARFVVMHCMDNLDGEPAKGGAQAPGQYYESIDLVDAFHPQTILAHSLNRQPLDEAHGAPLRLRVERQLGYKHAKYLARIEVTDSLARLGMGRGGYWEDRGYEWYAGI